MDFKVGNIVTFELGYDGMPRWDFSTDQGGSGIWATGTVTSVYERPCYSEDYIVEVSFNNDFGSWQWPLSEIIVGHPGYLTKSKKRQKLSTFKAKSVFYVEVLDQIFDEGVCIDEGFVSKACADPNDTSYSSILLLDAGRKRYSKDIYSIQVGRLEVDDITKEEYFARRKNNAGLLRR